ncbi:MAG TPA: phage tail tip lysozyme [Streptosporangiaceae bacterium]
MRAASAPHRKKTRNTGRHRAAPSTTRKAARVAGVVVPVLALAGAIVGTQFHSDNAAAIPGNVTSYQVTPDATGQLGAAAESVANAAIARLTLPRHKKSAGAARPATPKSAAAKAAAARAAQAKAKAKAKAQAARLVCSGSGSADPAYLPANYAAIVNFMTAHGYTKMAAVGMAGNMYQESRGNPESIGTGGGGLIGWTPLPAGLVTGNVAADLQTQLAAVLVYNQQWAQYIPMLNAATSAVDAAYIYMAYFERPGLPATSNRETAASEVAAACGFGS